MHVSAAPIEAHDDIALKDISFSNFYLLKCKTFYIANKQYLNSTLNLCFYDKRL